MKLIYFLTLIPFLNFAQSFAPPAGIIGTTALYKDSSIFVAWANGIDFQRGYLNISNKSLGLASYGLAENALNEAEGNSFDIVSFGDSGVAILTFENPIQNGDGNDFAVFENSFSDDYLEFAFVEVSSDGINFVRFPVTSETQTASQINGLGLSDCRYVNNLAGKYRQGYGTPFDLEELVGLVGQNTDLNNIRHVKLIDVVGSIDANFGTFDSQGTIINEPWPSEFASGGFDLDAVGVINQYVNSLNENSLVKYISITEDEIVILNGADFDYKIYDLSGKQFQTKENSENKISIQNLANGFYFLNLQMKHENKVVRFYKN
ncbi:MAG: T9SS type A sorting domain-containing protein [Bacteroidota bacterium]